MTTPQQTARNILMTTLTKVAGNTTVSGTERMRAALALEVLAGQTDDAYLARMHKIINGAAN